MLMVTHAAHAPSCYHALQPPKSNHRNGVLMGDWLKEGACSLQHHDLPLSGFCPPWVLLLNKPCGLLWFCPLDTSRPSLVP